VIANIGGQQVPLPPRISAELTEEAWETYGNIEDLMVRTANESGIKHLALPTFERLSRSLLKMAVLLGAQRQQPVLNKIEITNTDVLDAAWYVNRWGSFSIDLISNTGKGTAEKQLEKIINAIKSNPGILRSTLMQHQHLSKRQADDILATLEDRQIVYKEKAGRGWKYWAS